MKSKLLTLEQAYTAMYLLFSKQYFKTLSDDLGSLLGSMSTLKDDVPMDTAIWIDWATAVSTVLGEANINKIMKPVINVWKKYDIEVDITVKKKEILFITAATLPHNIKIDQVISELSTTNSLLPIFDDLRSYKKIIFRITTVTPNPIWVIVDEQRMEKLRKLFHSNQQKNISS